MILAKILDTYLTEITDKLKVDIQSQYIAKYIEYNKGRKEDTSTISKKILNEFENIWSDINSRMTIVPGKIVLKQLREAIQNDYQVNMTDVQIIDEFKRDEISDDLVDLILKIEEFRKI